MTVIIGLALGLLIGGLVVAWLSSAMKQPTLATIVYWVGVVLVLIGLVLLLTPVLVWISTQIREMIGQ